MSGNYLTSFKLDTLTALDLALITKYLKNLDMHEVFLYAMKCSTFDLANAPASEMFDIVQQFGLAVALHVKKVNVQPDVSPEEYTELVKQLFGSKDKNNG